MNSPLLRLDLRFVNVYLLQTSSHYVLVDTGIGEVWQALEEELLKIGALPDLLKLVLLTHGDKDHTGNCKKLQEKYHVPVALHPGDLNMVENGRSPRRRGTNLAGRFSIWFDSKISSEFGCFTPDVFLQDGQNLEPYGLPARVIHTPGHTPGSICLLTERGELIVGDTFTNRKKPRVANIVANNQDLQASLEKLAKLDARMVYPGHGKPFLYTELLNLTKNKQKN